VIEEISDAIVRDLPAFGKDSELAAAVRDSVDDNARLFIAMVERGVDPSAAEPPAMANAFVRLVVHRGIPVEALAQTYRTAHGAFWRTWVTELRGAISDPTELATALEQGSGYMFEFIDTLTAAAQRLYAEERARWIRSADAVRAQTIRELLDGLPVDAAAAGRRLRHALDREHLAVVAWSTAGGVGAASLEPAVRDLLAPLGAGPPLTTVLGTGLLAGWVGSRNGFDPEDVEGLRLGGAPARELGAIVAAGTPARGVDGFRLAHLEAMHARRVAQLELAPPGSVIHYASVAVTALASADQEQARRFVEQQLGPILGDDRESARLLETLAAYLEEHASPRHAAVRLGVHENTVAARIRTAEARLARPLRGRTTELLVALRLAPLVRG
jgi:DNA-binding PucR family transcriptional regulator